MNSFKSLRTTFEYSGSKAEVSLMTEVKQGNPLSSFIFNAIMDSLLEQMKGYVIE
jgi:hypothetical protein